jgi:hypothetical protein
MFQYKNFGRRMINCQFYFGKYEVGKHKTKLLKNSTWVFHPINKR